MSSPQNHSAHVTRHLDENAFAALVSGGQFAEAHEGQAHLELCAECREELACFQEAVNGFSLASFAWSESRSEAKVESQVGIPPARALPIRVKTSPRLFPAVSWALAALLVVGAAIPMKLLIDHQIDQQHAQAVGTTNSPAGEDALNSPEQVAKDNQFMAEVHDELSRSPASLLAQYGRQRGNSAQWKAKAHAGERTQ